MWRRALNEVFSFMGCMNNKSQLIWVVYAVRGCSGLALPVQRITALQAAHSWSQLFQEKGVSEPDLSSRYITAHVLGAKTFESVKAETLSEPLCPEKTLQIWKLCAKRLKRMPVQYVIEEWDFRDLTLKMRPPVFIPRPETEELVDIVLSDLQKESGSLSILEVGCGSGAISLSLLKSFPQLRAVALDQSEDAVHLTKENALSLGVEDRLQLYHLDILKDAETILNSCSGVSAVVSNPPYLYTEDMLSLQPEVLSFEDPAALDGGADGLTVIKQVLILASQILLNHGRVYLEVDPRQPPLIQQWVESHLQALCYVETKQDFNNRARFCILQKQETNKTHKQD
ncbi:MTRF1L release factor glutamine methyltransferase [Periophthalmus magnuspinnatus]|uniref:MTRF1L release factor glutamine methyltransferase n=1 Tax=Periophthalmus magnuspinnatus TaxID=409849 RepID=UPI00145A5934|nr:MTRF1L release factor glutamine methyltransferase [Periophthalmus magnuspinnatus]